MYNHNNFTIQNTFDSVGAFANDVNPFTFHTYKTTIQYNIILNASFGICLLYTDRIYPLQIVIVLSSNLLISDNCISI